MKKSIIIWSALTVFLLAGSGIPRAALEEDDVIVEKDDVIVEEDDVIVAKNLFHPERKKWEMERPDKKKKEKKPLKNPKALSRIRLYGTVITGDKSYAVLRTTKGKKTGENRVYMVGDYISGFMVKEIERKKIVLEGADVNEDFVVFINDGKKKRSVAKTEIKRESARITRTGQKEGQKVEGKPGGKSKKKARKPKKAKTADFLRKRLKRHAKVLRTKDSALVKKQALKDYKKIEKLLPHMSAEAQREVMELKNEIDRAGAR